MFLDRPKGPVPLIAGPDRPLADNERMGVPAEGVPTAPAAPAVVPVLREMCLLAAGSSGLLAGAVLFCVHGTWRLLLIGALGVGYVVIWRWRFGRSVEVLPFPDVFRLEPWLRTSKRVALGLSPTAAVLLFGLEAQPLAAVAGGAAVGLLLTTTTAVARLLPRIWARRLTLARPVPVHVLARRHGVLLVYELVERNRLTQARSR